MNTTMDYDQWALEEELELFASFPLDQKPHANVQDGLELSDMIGPAGNLLDQLDAIYPADNELFPKWMSEKINLNFLEEIQEMSNEVATDALPLLPSEGKNEKLELSDLDILNQLVADSVTTMQPLPVQESITQGDALPAIVTEFSNDQYVGLDQDELWEAISAASGLSSPASFEDMAVFSSGSPASSEDMAVFSSGSPASSEDMAVHACGSPASSEDMAVSSPGSDNPVSPLPPVETKLIAPKPSKSKARPVLKTAGGTVKPSRKERKKDQNKKAATRYREKKRTQSVAVKGDLEVLEKRNEELKDTVESMTKEIKYLKDLLQEVLAVKGRLKEMGQRK